MKFLLLLHYQRVKLSVIILLRNPKGPIDKIIQILTPALKQSCAYFLSFLLKKEFAAKLKFLTQLVLAKYELYH